MAMSDPIADLLTRIRNGLHSRRSKVQVPASRVKEQMLAVLEQEGFILGYRRLDDSKQGVLEVDLKYQSSGEPVIKGLRRVSKPSLRVYKGTGDVKQVRTGLGISIMTTSRGIMTNKQARKEHVGGEVLCEVW